MDLKEKDKTKCTNTHCLMDKRTRKNKRGTRIHSSGSAGHRTTIYYNFNQFNINILKMLTQDIAKFYIEFGFTTLIVVP